MQTLPALDRVPDKERRMLNQFNTSSQQRAKNTINGLTILSLENPLDLVNYTQNKEAQTK